MEHITFIRWGGLSAQKQTHRRDQLKDSEPGQHTPPRKNGVYAFVNGYVDLFLLGATYHPANSSGKSAWLKDANGNKIIANPDWEYDEKREHIIYPKEVLRILKANDIKQKYVWTSKLVIKKFDLCKLVEECDECPRQKECEAYNEEPEYLVYLKKPRIFSYTGDLWHHLKETTTQGAIIEEWGNWVKTSYEDYVNAFEKNRHKLLKDAHKDIKYYEKDLRMLNDLKGRTNPYKKSPYVNYNKDLLEVFIEKI